MYTGETVSVYGFKGDEHDASIPIATCATKVVTKTGITYILVCPNMLYYGRVLPRSLVNPNQLRAAGVIVHDDPTIDREKEFGLITDRLCIPFETAGATVYFESFAPSYAEVEEHLLQVIGPDEWNPLTVRLRDFPLDDNRAVEINALRAKNMVPFRELCEGSAPMELYEVEHEPQVLLSSVSIAYDEKAMDRALLSKLVTEKRHSPITAEEVSKKFAIGLDTAKKTLQVTTQRGVRHAIHPIHRRYRTDHLDLHRKRLGGTWFMDTLVARCQSLQGNKYMHVITNGKCIRAFSVKEKLSNLAAGALEDFINDVEVPSVLWTDRAKECVG